MRLLIAITLLVAAPAFAQSTRDAAQESQQQQQQSSQQERPRSEARARTNGGSLMRSQLEAIAGEPLDGAVRQRSEYDRVAYGAVKTPEPRVIRKHDLVTVIVREQSEFKSQASSDMKKDAKLAAELTDFIKLNIPNLSLDPAIGSVKPKIGASASDDWKGDGKFDRKDQFTTRVQAEVVDIKPNGNVVLQARTKIKTDDEEQLFVLSGMIRAQDITPDNSVLSTQMYDLELNKQHQGTLREATRRGWLARFLDKISPI
jgi:flagellar L-ring protein precursor FlgH